MATRTTQNDNAAVLEKHGIRPSYQRIQVYSFLCGSKNHPGVDSIYLGLIDIIPTLSKTTVYNTLRLFERQSLVQVLTIEGGELRFDACTTPHAHFKCLKCGMIFDIPIEDCNATPNMPEGFTLTRSQCFLWGYCVNCATKE